MILRRLLRFMQNDKRVWPRYMPGGRVRTSTLGLIVAFIALFWLYQVYEPPVRPAQNPAQQVVPPGFVPDPDYTWVPRTQVEAPVTTTWRPPRTSTTTTTPTTTSPTETPTTTTPTSPTTTPPSTTVIDPDGPGLLPPRTITETPAPGAGPLPSPGLPPPLP
ncbi:hypothetical protein [Mycolicibacterium monacense]|uniref:Proline rich protein n=3 Tax=Mycobacteriaceae TaxID=1762 RepID=A0AAD1N0G2_MYCMB|nr:hypothetical protein [Mycolicibacterium monacense]MDA4103840.1 hypothetical protein [Mycolicibacterium monacense DSM 44395]ORB23093.1 hypothetical protein BST34_03695 [Mycolicibacterium monacense DSM 44395]QHP85359.1 hypothetical protein EWR22_08195 [Mycolicibacterium monacense DSM 44395]BBZ61776.1 hypothetical protein MMON_30770 [Mycolicibacterium monacense]